jgi:hypothetical protein
MYVIHLAHYRAGKKPLKNLYKLGWMSIELLNEEFFSASQPSVGLHRKVELI